MVVGFTWMLACIESHRVCLQELNNQLKARPVAEDKFAEWRQDVQKTNEAFPLAYPKRTDVIMPQWAIEVRRHPQLKNFLAVTLLPF